MTWRRSARVRAKSVVSRFFLLLLAFGAWPAMSASAASLTFAKIVDNHTLIPGTNTYFDFNNSDVPAIAGTAVVFDTADSTIWYGQLGKSGRRKLVDTQTPIPNRQGTFQQFYGNTVQIYNSAVIFVGMDCSGCNSGVGIYKIGVTGNGLAKLVDTNDLLPKSRKDKFGGFPIDFKVRDGIVAFQNGQKVYAVPVAGGPVVAVAGPQDSGFNPPGNYCCIFDSPDIEQDVVVLRTGNVFGRGSIQQVRRTGNPNTFRVIADGGTHAPATPGTYRFDDFTFGVPLIDNNTVIFHAQSNNTDPFTWDVYDGLYARGIKSGFHKLVDDHTRVPGTRGYFSRSGGFPQVAANGIVVFIAQDAAAKAGIYAVRVNGGPITKIMAQGDPIPGTAFVADSFSMGPGAMSGNTLAFRINYGNFQGAGMYYTDLSSVP